MRFISILLIALLLTLGGCGYRWADADGTLVSDVSRVYVPIFKNTTLEPFVEGLLSDEVVRELGRRQSVQVVSRPDLAQAVLNGKVVGYRNRAISYDPEDEIAEYRVEIRIKAELRRIDTNEVVWQGQLTRHDEYLADDNAIEQQDRERDTQRVVARLLAEDLYIHLAEGF